MTDLKSAPSLTAWLDYISTTNPRDIEMGLERVRAVAERMGLLPVSYRTVIVGGTNGKGSTCIAASAVLQALGYKVGVTMSPHIISFNERIIIDNEQISDMDACRGFEVIEDARGDIRLTYFEFSALLALYFFKISNVDVGILEIGLGGRLDAFNIVDADIAVITSISLDHTELLGDTVEDIGKEKAGIFRPGQPVVLGPGLPLSVYTIAHDLGCSEQRVGSDFLFQTNQDSWSYSSPLGVVRGIKLSGVAPINGSLGLHSSLLVDKLLKVSIFKPDSIKSHLENVSLPGRLEMQSFMGRQFIFDVAHNPAGAEFLVDQLKSRFTDRTIYGIFGGLRDKDTKQVLDAFDGVVHRWYGMDISGARGLKAEEIVSRISDGVIYSPVGDSLEVCNRIKSETDSSSVILVCGSFAAVEQLKRALNA